MRHAPVVGRDHDRARGARLRPQRRREPEARGDGGERDPLATVSTGFRLTATLRAKPSATSTVVIPPYYGCMPHAFAFSGAAGGTGQQGGHAPDVTVRLAALPS